MRSLSIVLGLLALAVSRAYGTALTYKLGASERACFFTNIEIAQAKIAFYFAVGHPPYFVISRVNQACTGTIGRFFRCRLSRRRSE